MKILVVDDDAMAAEMSAAVLEDLGHDLLIAQDGMDAIHHLNTDPDIGLIISDMNMPLVSGIDLFRELREQGNLLPFILLTGDEPAPLLAQEPRLDGCLIKDFSLDESLPALVAQVLQRSHN